jgi:exonuclease III
LLAEIDRLHFHLAFNTETWRLETEEIIEPPSGHYLFLAGGSGHCGTGVVVSRELHSIIRNVSFHAFSARLCCLKFDFAVRSVAVFTCYFPTSWASDDEVFELYELLHFVLANVVREGRSPILGGDFNACVDFY